MFWNCTCPDFVVQDPPSYHCNWAIGCVGPITNIGQWTTNPLGIVESKGTKIVAIPSLFKAQLAERLKTLVTAVENPVRDYIDFQVVPNPVSNQFEVKIQLQKSSSFDLNLCDLSGKTIKNLIAKQPFQTENTTYVFSAKNMKSGIYIIQLSSGALQKSSKLIIQN